MRLVGVSKAEKMRPSKKGFSRVRFSIASRRWPLELEQMQRVRIATPATASCAPSGANTSVARRWSLIFSALSISEA